MQNLDCSIILVNYNTCQLTLACIDSIREFSTSFSYEIIVVDNDSSDNSVEVLSKLPYIKFIEFGKNAGFGAANNLGAKNAVGKYLFLLNTDTILIDNSIKILLDFYRHNEGKLKIGTLGATLIDENQNIINSGGNFPTVDKYVNAYLRRPVKEYKIAKNDDYQQIDYVTGADLMISKRIYEEIEGFDENFFLYYEETDLQKRIQSLGYINYLITTTRIIHLEGGSDFGSTVSNFKRIVIHQSRNRFLRKHDGKNFFKYIFLDFFMTIGRLALRNYTWKEKVTFCKANFKSYF
ncbi:glycosyltransferase family 2 protein [Chryseobacterium polytrichastri]|uniref:Glycosyltransferase 2-like domain-containing protein n=1 Tax=Chryseobacterium polytrichastri TaxID=1302687 RepID=A0A1M6U4M9_9FLAO|nr:glycosyltransferase family 2 protein [Chryseobacterium polytrichastri]SHK64114.1 hypothetical protein SAMN05444267_100643 [Chryseobacterium polytrichastri]